MCYKVRYDNTTYYCVDVTGPIHVTLMSFICAFRTLFNIYDGSFLQKIVNGLQPLNVLQRKLDQRCLTGF